jgi:diguanylate cyclase (GGDEF)-like protein
MSESASEAAPQDEVATEGEQAFSCALSATLIARVHRVAGDTGVHRLLTEAKSTRGLDYLTDIGNWISMDETLALWRAGEIVTKDPNFARHVGEDAVRVLGSSSTATTLRALGSPEELLRNCGVAAHRFSIAANLDTPVARAGYAEVRAVAAAGFRRERLHCDWTTGMLSQSASLFGLPPARVEHDSCAALGAPDCVYKISWDADAENEATDAAQVGILKKQLDAMSARLQSVFETAADLIASGDLNETLARITDRAAAEVRAPKYLLAVRPTDDSELLRHHKGLDDAEARDVARRIFLDDPSELPDHWCVARVRSHRNDYGRLVAVYQEGATFFPQERELLELYARYAATALDSATALLEARLRQDEAQRRHEEASTLLDLARRLAEAGTSDNVAVRLADAIPGVVDCDRVSVHLWDEEAGENVRKAVNAVDGSDPAGPAVAGVTRPEDVPQLARWLEHPDPEPYFIDVATSALREPLREVGAVASVAVPIATTDRFLGCVVVSVRHDAARLANTSELRDRLSGVAAHAVTALENGRLVDHITHQARHDRLTGLANRLAFGERLAEATEQARQSERPIALFYVDLDGFKPVNDEFGHEIGDELLRGVAERLLGCVRGDDSVARLGGDEFAILVDGIGDSTQLDAVSTRLERAFDAPFDIQGHTLRIRASIGRAVWPAEVEDLDALLRSADAAMYDVKRGRHSRSAQTSR